ncbi:MULTISPECIES: DUF3630 family protein [Shewanella]|jgi:hypothetical protein|uniref:DUF3630 family protein n=1 Tax=Shewanella TaxID=22 RepID=UPI00200D2A17|nr:DUF3630 family protein [Shewanella basaltis]MCL1112030.1 DUF3630 family protein [Shewanella basaltis]
MKLLSAKFDPDALSIMIQAQVDFEQFEQFAEPLAAALDCDIRERQWGADRHQWLLNFEGCPVWLHYEFYGDICWLSVDSANDIEVLGFLTHLLTPLIETPQEGLHGQ